MRSLPPKVLALTFATGTLAVASADAAELDRYLQAVFEVTNAGAPGRPPLVYLAHAALRHRRTQTVLVLPARLQAQVFRLAFALGALAGRYRGTDWPGGPARCTGVPEISAHTD